MFGLSGIDSVWAEMFFYIFLRISGAVLISPIFGRRSLPVIMRIGFCLYLSIMVALILPESAHIQTPNTIAFFGNAVKETVFGLILGYVSVTVLTIAVSAGQIIDMQIGFGLSNFFDQQLGAQVALSGNFLNIITILTFFMVNGHHRLIKLIFHTFEQIGPGRVQISQPMLGVIFQCFAWFIVMVVQAAIPIISVIIITEFALGIVMKLVPQMNFFVIGISLKVFIGLLILMVFISTYIMYLNGVFDRMFEWYYKIIIG